MRRMQGWWLLATAVSMMGLAACGGDNRPMVDGGDAGGPDGGNADAGDPCEGLTLCTTPGTSCSGDNLVTCAANTDGCLVETTTDCTATGGTCDDSGATAMCSNDPCMGVDPADRCTTAGFTCEAEVLVECAANTNGCLVRTETDCAASPGGVCDETAATPVCALPPDPCASIPASERCTTAGTSCDANNLTTCAPNAFGCLVNTVTACDSRAGGTCDSTGTPACTFTGDPCASVAQCTTEGTSCSGPSLVTCARDGFGCLVETTVDCTSTMFGFCDADATPAPACSTAAVDPCMGMTLCTPEGRACDSNTLRVCARNAFGCLVETATDCTATSEVCGDQGGMAVCDDVCAFRTTCPSASYCDAADAVTCTPDADGCLIESARTTCSDSVCAAGACAGMCPGIVPSVLDCASGTVNGNTAMGTANINNYACRSYSYPNNEQVHGFRAATDSLVRVVATRGSGSSRDYDLYVLNAGDGTAPCGSTLTCAGASTGTTATETVTFAATAGQLYYVAYDLFGTTAETIDYTLEVSCSPLPTNTTCAGAMPITATTALTGELIDIGGARPTGTGCGTTAGNNARYYSVTVPANGFVDVRTSSSTGLDRVLLVQDACGDTCTFQTNTSPESTVLTNTTASDVTRIVVIANSSATGTGTFDITFTYGTLPTNTSCATATPVTTTPASFTGQLIDLGGPRPTGTNCGTSSGNNALYYLVTVPAGGAVGVSTAGAFDRVLLVQNACSDTDCAVRTDTAPESTILTNPSSADVTRVVVVYNYSSSGRGAFDISFAPVAFETETEPNEDGTPSTGSDAIAGNDLDATAITNADANGAITTTTIVTAALTPAGDEDVFAITNTGTTPRSVTISTGAPTYDVCPSGDTGLRIVRSDLSVVTTSDDEGAGACSLATVTIPAGATYYAQVVEYDDDEALDPYQLFVLFN